jgi:hypothetical protein
LTEKNTFFYLSSFWAIHKDMGTELERERYIKSEYKGEEKERETENKN